MRVTSKGQVTIPQELREQFCLFPMTEVEFEIAKRGILIRRAKKAKSHGEKIVERMRGRSDVKMSTDEIMGLTRGKDGISS